MDIKNLFKPKKFLDPPPENKLVLRQRAAFLKNYLISQSKDCRNEAIDREIEALDTEEDGQLLWQDVQRCEILSARIMPFEDLGPSLDRWLTILQRSRAKDYEKLNIRWDALKEEYDTAVKSTAQDQRRPAIECAARSLLASIQEAAHVRSTRNFVIRNLATLYARNLLKTCVLCATIIVLIFALEIIFVKSGFAGFLVALTSGLLGAVFSSLITQRSVTSLDNLEEIRTAVGYPMICLRLGVGVCSAAILFFCFESQLIDGLLFPDLKYVGFNLVGVAAVEGEPPQIISMAEISNFLAGMKTDGVLLRSQLEALSTAADMGENAQKDLEAILKSTSNIEDQRDGVIVALQGIVEQELGKFAPNSNLSKLVVWSFLAGFSERLVPSILGRVENSAQNNEH